ncbi:hypothetical protein ACHAPM_007992 [Fusarium culmorum]
MEKLPSSTEQPTMEQKGKSVAQDQGSKTDKIQQDNYTQPPRVSFGIELEFLVAHINRNRLDVDKDMPGLAPAEQSRGIFAVQALLEKHGFLTALESGEHSSADQLWIISADLSVKERDNRSDDTYCTLWDAVEISSPPLYASEEAYNLISALVRLLTTNLRVRVNSTCGLHVHVGNGHHQIDLRALRNYAALLWASEPVLSTLDCPTRSFNYWSKSIRRRHSVNLARGATANEAHGEMVAKQPPVASQTALLQHLRVDDDNPLILELGFDDDESEWEDADSQPFQRRRKHKGPRREELKEKTELQRISETNARLLDNESTRRELPLQTVFPASGTMASGASAGKLPLLDDQRTKKKPISVRDIDILPENRSHIWPTSEIEDVLGGTDAVEPNTKLTWKGVAELLACDIGAHQIAYLLTDFENGRSNDRSLSSNWQGQLPINLFPEKDRICKPTVECRFAGGTLDAEWVVTWAKIQCRLLEWARDADPAQFMSVIGKLSRDDHSQECTYDVLDFLRDVGMYTELKYCQERLRRCEEAWYQCMLLKKAQLNKPDKPDKSAKSN